jgi:hypothetical protein
LSWLLLHLFCIVINYCCIVINALLLFIVALFIGALFIALFIVALLLFIVALLLFIVYCCIVYCEQPILYPFVTILLVRKFSDVRAWRGRTPCDSDPGLAWGHAVRLGSGPGLGHAVRLGSGPGVGARRATRIRAWLGGTPCDSDPGLAWGVGVRLGSGPGLAAGREVRELIDSDPGPPVQRPSVLVSPPRARPQAITRVLLADISDNARFSCRHFR